MRYVVGFFATIGVLFMLLLGLVFYGFANLKNVAQRPPKPIPATAVLAIDLKNTLVEDTAGIGLPLPFLENKARLRDVVAAINRAAGDARIKGLLLRLEGGATGMAQAQELTDALQRFRDKKKFTAAWADTLGEGGPANGPYLLASQTDEIWVQPQGTVGLTGFGGDFLFYKNALEKIGVKFEVWKRKEFKSAADQFVEPALPAPVRANYESLLGDVQAQLLDRVATARKLDQAAVRATLDRAPLLAKEALDARLIDRIGYRDEAEGSVLSHAGAGAQLVEFAQYRASYAAPTPPANATHMAVIYGVGLIDRHATRDIGDTDPVMAPEALRKAFDEAIKDHAVKAIIFRVDSPGGSPVASESIRRDVLRAKEAGKKVIVSMGNVAASGGYWVSMDADKIVAQPGTITGSIGVVGSKIDASGLASLVGIHVDNISTSDAARLSMWRPSSPQQRERQDARIDATYNDFVSAVAAGRKLPREKVEEIARGRVWTGKQAKEIGLVDELGGMDVAFKVARAELGLPPEAPIAARLLPQRRTPAEQLMRALQGETASLGTLVAMEQRFRPLLRVYDELVASDDSRMLLMQGPAQFD